MPTAADYLEQLKALLPPGQAFPRDAGTTLHTLLDGMSIELARVDGWGDLLPIEANPASTNELLGDWERVAGLPDKCSGTLEETLQGRRNALLAKLASTGGQSPAYFIGIAAALGYEVTITEFKHFRVGMSVAGDALTNGDWQFAWQVNAPETTTVSFRVGLSAVGEALRTWGSSSLECKVRQLSPAHTIPIFAYANSSLDLNFALDTYLVKQQSVPFASIVTFTRASTRTRYNAAKQIEQLGNNVAGFNHSPVNGIREGLLIEAAATNKLPRSQSFNVAPWSTAGASITPNVLVAPDGSATASKITESATLAAHEVRQIDVALSGNTYYCRSIFAKTDGSGRNLILASDYAGEWVGGYTYVSFDLVAGTTSAINAAPGSYGMDALADGWYRCWMSKQSVAAPAPVRIFVHMALGNTTNYLGDGVSGLYIWGMQFEESTYPSTYIPTAASTVTRAIDLATVVPDPTWYGQTAGTFVADIQTSAPLTDVANDRRHLLSLINGNDQLFVYLQTGGVATVTRTTAGGIFTQSVFGGDLTSGKVAIAFDGVNITVALNGVVRTVSGGLDIAALGSGTLTVGASNTIRQINGVVRSLRYYPRRVSDADLLALTLP